MRIICWFSCGAASAVATKLVLDEYANTEHEVVIAYTYVKNEHKDSMRFLKECEAWFGRKITILKDEKYNADVDVVIEKGRFMSSPAGARCTMKLKKEVRKSFQKPNDVHVFGFDISEPHRIDRIIDAEPEIRIKTPLIDKGYSKDMCFTVIESAGIELPEMYKLGYHNNNCIGCLKAQGAGYWNKIRKDFPEVFNRRAKQEELLNVALVRLTKPKFERDYPDVMKAIQAEESKTGLDILKEDDKGYIRVPLRFLPPDAGTHKDLVFGSCGFLCELLQ